MGWARLDDGFHDHHKIVGLSLEAVGLFTLALTWAHRQRCVQLGHIPSGLPRMIAGGKGVRLTEVLVKRGLWDVDEAHGGWLIHDFTDYLAADDDHLLAGEKRKKLSETRRAAALARWEKEESKRNANAEHLHSNSEADGMPPTRTRPKRPKPLAPTDGRTPKVDPVWDALVEVCGINPAEITTTARGAMNKAAAELRAVGATPEAIRSRAASYRAKWPKVSLTPAAIARRWSEVAAVPPGSAGFSEVAYGGYS